MRLTVLALTILPFAAQAQETTLPAPSEPLAQSQACPVGMTWNAAAQACGIGGDATTPAQSLPGQSGCSGSMAREVTS